jgi:hypothetical protein
MPVDIPPSILLLLPSILQLLERALEEIGFLSIKSIKAKIAFDNRPVIKATFVTPKNGPAILNAVSTYFKYNKLGNEIITLHISFFLSLLFGAMENSGEILKIEGGYVAGVCIVFGSFCAFVFTLLRSEASAPSAARPFPVWSIWTWTMFVVIIAFEGIERTLKS